MWLFCNTPDVYFSWARPGRLPRNVQRNYENSEIPGMQNILRNFREEKSALTQPFVPSFYARSERLYLEQLKDASDIKD